MEATCINWKNPPQWLVYDCGQMSRMADAGGAGYWSMHAFNMKHLRSAGWHSETKFSCKISTNVCTIKILLKIITLAVLASYVSKCLFCWLFLQWSVTHSHGLNPKVGLQFWVWIPKREYFPLFALTYQPIIVLQDTNHAPYKCDPLKPLGDTCIGGRPCMNAYAPICWGQASFYIL